MGQDYAKTSTFMLALIISCLFGSGMVNAYVVPAVDYPLGNRDSLTQSQLQFLRYVLGTDGVVALTNVPGLKEARENCLISLGRCYQAGFLRHDLTLEVLLADGTKRTTLAAKVNTVDEDYGCPGLGAKMRTLQTIIDEASKVFGKALDSSVLNPEETPLFMAIDNPSRTSYRDFSSVVEHGDHLDHFHVYEKSTQSMDDSTEALERHTDQGLFVAIVPSITMKNGKPIAVNDGFELELPLPKGLTRVTIPNNGESILFMLGDGVLNWISKQATTVPLRSVPHRLVMESRSGVARAWFGRMFFPPKDAFIHKQQTTFDKFRMESVEVGARGDVAYVGCSNQHHILRDLTESACGENEIYCWMGCRPTSGLHCTGNQTIECVNQKTHEIWTDETSHCFDCTASCYGERGTDDQGKNGTDNNGGSISGDSNFCNTKAYPTNMYMDGFNGLGPNVPCLIFLFQSWVLDTQVKYAFGSIGAFLIGMLIEYIVYARRQMKSPRPLRANRCMRWLPDTKQTTTHSVVMILLYGTQLVFAYFAMLLAMSFAAVIFSMVMLGLTFGHLCFNFNTPAKNNEACCAANDEVCQPSTLHEPLRNGTPDCCGEAPTTSSSPTANDSISTSPAIV